MIVVVIGVLMFAILYTFKDESIKYSGVVKTAKGKILWPEYTPEGARRGRAKLKVGDVIYFPDGEKVEVKEGLYERTSGNLTWAWDRIKT